MRTSQSVCCLSLYRASHTFTLKVRIHCYGYSCVYNSCRDGCNVDDQRLTGDASSQANTAVSNSSRSELQLSMHALLQNTHAAAFCFCGLANFDCIMYSKTSDKLRSQRLEMASNGTGQSRYGSCDLILSSKETVLFMLAVFVFLTPLCPLYLTIFLVCLFVLLNMSLHLLPELLTDIEAHTVYLTKASKLKHLRKHE